MSMLFRFWLIPLFGMFFAAGADALAGVGGGAEIPAAGDTGADTGDETDAVGDAVPLETKEPTAEEKIESREEPEVQEFRGHVSARLRGLVKQSPKLAEAFKENPKLQEQIEATFRREAALREIFPTVAEARQLREALPNGLADLQQLQSDIKEVEELDNDFYTKGADGSYPGHAKIIDNMFRDDRNAAVALFRSLPKEWARLDRDSYNEVMGRIVGATIANAGIMEFIGELAEAAGDNKNLKAGLTRLAKWAEGYLAEKPRPSAEEERLSRDRAEFDRQKQESTKEETKRFDATFGASNHKVEQAAIKAHPAVLKLLASKTITDQKKVEIIEQVRLQVAGLLKQSPSFMGKLRAAYNARNLNEASNVVKAAWSEQWRLNGAIRKVFNKEIPQLVSSSRDAVKRRAGTPTAKPPAKPGDNTPKGPIKINGRWFRDGGKGAPFTTQEVLAGKHLES